MNELQKQKVSKKVGLIVGRLATIFLMPALVFTVAYWGGMALNFVYGERILQAFHALMPNSGLTVEMLPALIGMIALVGHYLSESLFVYRD